MYRCQATAPGKARCTSQNIISPAAVLQSWYRKYHQYLTDECKDDPCQDIAPMILNESGSPREEHPKPDTPRAKYAEGGRASSSATTTAGRDILHFLWG